MKITKSEQKVFDELVYQLKQNFLCDLYTQTNPYIMEDDHYTFGYQLRNRNYLLIDIAVSYNDNRKAKYRCKIEELSNQRPNNPVSAPITARRDNLEFAVDDAIRSWVKSRYLSKTEQQ